MQTTRFLRFTFSDRIVRPVLFLAAAVALGGPVSVQGREKLDLAIFQPSLKRLDNLPRSLEDEAKVELGRHLFYEKRLSKDNSISCNSCHDLNKYGVDGEAFSFGVGKVQVGRNSPTVYNTFGHLSQFWDGRASTLEEQAKGPILAGKEMAMDSPEAVVEKLNAIPEYRFLFHKAFPRSKDPITYDNIGISIGLFERYLTTPSRFDAYLDGKKDALTCEEQRGLKAFVDHGCVTCHDGTLVGGQKYQKAGLIKPWSNDKDTGRYEVTKKDDDKYLFKVPSLRNIAKTAPYFHDSSQSELKQAVETMADHQLGKQLPQRDVEAIVVFLHALSGELPTDYIAQRPLATASTSDSFE